MTVNVRENFTWERRPAPPDHAIVINRYSAMAVLVICRAHDIAERHGQLVVRVEHFIEALFADSEARMRMRELDYADTEDLRKHRFQLLSRRAFAASQAPRDALAYSDRLKVWFNAAQEVAAKREPELHTITVDDFVAALNEDLDSEAKELESLQGVLAQYKLPPTLTLRAHADSRFDKVDRSIADAHHDLGRRLDLT